MKARMVLSWMLIWCLWHSQMVFAGDSSCYGYTSTTSHFACNIPPWNSGNCTWWAAYKRSDLASEISGSGWDGGKWYGKFQSKGIPVGSVPKPGSVVDFSSPGHVAYIEKVNSDGSFDVTEMDAFGSIGFVNGVNYATYHRNTNGTYHRNNGTQQWILNGFIYPRGISSESDNTCDYGRERCDIRIQGSVGWFPPVTWCHNATQWFIISTNQEGDPYPIGSRPNADYCPLSCSSN